MRRISGISLAAIVILSAGPVSAGSARPESPDGRELAPAMAPFEYLIGRWKGQAVSKDNASRLFRGWTETHAWAWVFSAGKPVGMSITIEDGRFLRKGTLSYDAKARRYHLEGKPTDGQSGPLIFEGMLDSSGKLLTMERVIELGRERLTLRANSNYVRNTMTLDRKEEGAALFKPAIEVGLTVGKASRRSQAVPASC